MADLKELQEKQIEALKEELRKAHLAVDSLNEARQKDVKVYRGQLNDLSLEKERAVLKCEQLVIECNSYKEEAIRQRKEANALNRKLTAMSERLEKSEGLGAIAVLKLETSERSRKESEKVAELFRLHLDDADEVDDNEWECDARQILWNDADTEALRERLDGTLLRYKLAGDEKVKP